ncbi:MAG: L-threonylcarbamoyladenylate synthase [bacterium]|nr:L-threonylcarbamoyladenylate synthase [bacterium]
MKKNELDKAIEIIKGGGVIVCPTDTVYGFIADATNKKAVEEIYKIKKRARSKPLPVFIRDIKMAWDIADISKDQEKVLKKYWPGKYTFILKIKKVIKLYGQDKKTIALRIPKYKFLNTLLKKINKPLAQTSVNISGEPELKKIKEIIEKFENSKNKPDLIINGGDLLKSKPSKIIDLTKNKIKILRV